MINGLFGQGSYAAFHGLKGHWLAVLAFNDAFDRKTAETLLLAIVVMVVVFLFALTTRKEQDKRS